MEAQKKNPLAALIAIAPGIINTAISLIKDKKKISNENVLIGESTQPAGTQFIQEDIGKGIQLSSKRLMNIGGTGLIITLAIADITTHGITKQNLCLVGLGILYSVAMSVITYLSERK